MCVTSGPAKLGKTIISISEKVVGQQQRLVHVLGYQNSPTNLSPGPNAMLIHFPTKSHMTPANVLDTKGCKKLLTDMVAAQYPPQEGVTRGGLSHLFSKAYVFESGIYTIVLAPKAELVYEALSRVPADKRPNISKELLQFYAQNYPGWPIALCCFNSKQSEEADPLMWWYEPMDTSTFMLPGIDCHTGGVPDYRSQITRTPMLIFGSDHFPSGVGHKVNYTDNIPDQTRLFLPKKVFVVSFREKTRNGDYILPRADVYQGNEYALTIR